MRYFFKFRHHFEKSSNMANKWKKTDFDVQLLPSHKPMVDFLKSRQKAIPPNPSLILSIINFIFNQPLSGAWPFERQINRIMPSTLRISASLSFSFFFPRRITATGNEIKRLWLLMLLHSCQALDILFSSNHNIHNEFMNLVIWRKNCI